MALPAAELARLVRRGADGPGAPYGEAGAVADARVLSLGGSPWGQAIDGVLPDGGLPRGAVVEVVAKPMEAAQAALAAQ